MTKIWSGASHAGVLLLIGATTAFAQGTGDTPNGRPFRNLQSQVDDLRTQIASLADLQAQIDALEVRVDQNTASVEELRQYNRLQDQNIALLGGAVLALEGRMMSAEATIEDIQTHDALQDQWLGVLETRFRNAELQLAAHAGDIQALWNAMSALQGWISGLQVHIDDLQRRISRVEQDVNAALGDISSLRDELLTAQSQIGGLQQQLSTKQTQLSQSCAPGFSIRQVNSNGTVICEFDDVSAGVGLLVSDTFFADNNIGPFSALTRDVFCQSGRVTGGGYWVSASIEVRVNRPNGANGWQVFVVNQNSSTGFLQAYVVCARNVP